MESEQIKKLRQRVVDQPEFEHLLRISQEIGAEVFLVGGLVRDGLLGKEIKDWDLAFSCQALKGAAIFADRTGGTLVSLRKEWEMARVVLQGRTFDFAKFRGPDLLADLRGRDFTVNAMALSLTQTFTEKEWVPYDPLNGILDLQNRVLRMTAADCFEQDPLRMLRAFRLSAQLNLTIDPETGRVIEKFAPSLTQSAPERIHYEWLMLLSQPASYFSLLEMARVGLLGVLFPEMNRLIGIDQDRYHHLDVYQHSLLTFHCLEDLIQKVIPLPEDLDREMVSFLKENKKTAWLKGAALFHDMGKAVTGDEKAGHRIFYGHAEASQKLVAPVADRFRLSNREKIFIDRMIGWHMRPLYLVQEILKRTLTQRAVTRFVREAGEELNGIFLLALADSLAAQGKEKPKDLEARLMEVWRKALSIRDEIIRPWEGTSPLISGRDLIALGFTPGPIFKTLLAQIQEAHWEGKVSNRAEALAWIRKIQTLDKGIV
jgi:poly(A) polymerase